MRTLAGLLVLGLSFGAASSATAGTPVLSVQSHCPDSTAPPGGTIQVPIALTADGALPGVTGLDFTLTYDAATLVVQSVMLSDAVAALGGWDAPATAPAPAPGTLPVLVAPKLQVPLPTFPAGPVAVVTFGVAASAPAACQAIDFAPDSVVFSAPPLGLAVPGGPPQAGGVQVATAPPPPEVCDDCADNDGDGLIDLADPDCGADALVLIKANVSAGKSRTTTDDRTTLRATLPEVSDVGNGIQLTLLGAGTPLFCEGIPGSVLKANRKGTRFTYQHRGDGLVFLELASHKGETTLTLRMKGRPLVGESRSIALSLATGVSRYYGAATLRPQRKRLVFP